MGSPFKMSPGKIGGTARTTGNGFASRGLVNPSALPMHEGKAHPKSESLSTESPSYTDYSTKITNTPGTSITSKTNSTGGNRSTSNYSDAQKGKKDLGPDFVPTEAQRAKANLEAKTLKDLDAANAKSNAESNASSSSKTVITDPSRIKKDLAEKINSYRISASDLQKGIENKNKTRASKDRMNKVIAGNQTVRDSAKVADDYRKTLVGMHGQQAMSDPAVTTEAVVRGNKAGRISAEKSGYFTKEEGNQMFNPDYGKSTVTAGSQGYKSKGNKGSTLKPGESKVASSKWNNQIVPGSKEDVGGQIKKGSKKGSKTFSTKNANPGTRGSRG